MRLPFGLGRRSGSADGASSDGSDAGSGAAMEAAGAGTAGAGNAPPPPAPRAWANLPAIQRTAGEMPLVAAPGRFVERLPGSAGLPPIVQPLGHEVSPLATPGVVVARVRAVEASAPGPIPAPVQRRVSRGAEAAATDAPALEPEPIATAPTVQPDAPVATAAPAPVEPPIRSMPTVSREAVRLPERPLTSAAVAARPAPVQRSTSAAIGADAPALPRPSGGMRRVPPPGLAAPVVSREVAHAHASPSATPASSPPQPAAAPSGPTRRGLGEPVQSAPASARPVASVLPGPVVSRSTTSGPMPIAASSLRPTAQRSPDGGLALPVLGSGPSEPAADHGPPMTEFRLPHLLVQRSRDGASHGPAASPSPASAAAATGPEIRPTAGANPIRPSIEIQRAAIDEIVEQAPDDELPSPWWSPTPALTSDVGLPGHAPIGLGGEAAAQAPTSIQRSTGGSAAPAIAPTTPRGAGQGRPTTLPGRSAPVAPPVQRTVSAAARPSALPQPVGIGGRHGATLAASVVESSAVSTAPSSGRAISGGPVVQTSPAGAAAPATPAPALSSFGSPTVVQREEANTPAAPAPGGSGVPSERDLDELAQALFGRIRGRLRNDLIYDREAKGLSFDNV